MASSSSSSLVRPKPRRKKTATTTATANTNSSSSTIKTTNGSTSSNKDKSATKIIQKLKPVTHSNTDVHCLPAKQIHRWQHWLYLARLYNGFYMLTAREQLVCHVAGWMGAILAGIYCYVFVRGFADGFQQHYDLMIVQEA
jgi:hypothetical protein